MVDTAIELSKELRDPNGEHKVDIIIALTHCRVPNVSLHLLGRG
jgi:2',3'-cyclic-nucleotide 2'-phosphodiesterase (5'-nucleotidase family)